MPKVPPPRPHHLSPAELVLKLIEEMRDKREMDIGKKLGELSELCVERISFASPDQAMQIISTLGQIISSDANPEVRGAALRVMERMIDLEEKAESKPGAPKINRTAVDVLLEHAKKEAQLAPSMTAAPSLMETALPERPHAHGNPLLAETVISPAAFMRILRSVAGADSEKNVREVAGRMIEKIQKQSVNMAPSIAPPALTEG